MQGKKNIVIGLFVMTGFMLYGFLLIYLRDFAPNATEWAAAYGNGKHFEARLAHVHGNLFAFLNMLIGYFLMQFKLKEKEKAIVSWTGIVGLLMPVGILMELLLGASPVFVLIGAVSMTASVFLLGLFSMRTNKLI